MQTITLYGRLGRDVEEKILDSGQRLLNLNLATSTKKAGQEETMWWRVTVWGDRFKNMEPYFKKGSALIVTGTLHAPSVYHDQTGTAQVSLQVTANHIAFSPFKSEIPQENQTMASQGYSQVGQPQQGQAKDDDISAVFDHISGEKKTNQFDDDEVPF